MKEDTMDRQTYLLTFEDVTPAEASRYADELRNALLDASDAIEVQLKRSNTNDQNFGDILMIVLSAPVAVAAINALSNWLQKRRSAKITLKDHKGTIILENITSKTAMEVLERHLSNK